MQWHPEKNAFENAPSPDGTAFEGINHSEEAVAATFALAQSFVAGRARRAIVLWRGTRGASRTVFPSERTGRLVGARRPAAAWDGGRRLVLPSSSCLVFVWGGGVDSVRVTGARTFETGFLYGIRGFEPTVDSGAQRGEARHGPVRRRLRSVLLASKTPRGDSKLIKTIGEETVANSS